MNPIVKIFMTMMTIKVFHNNSNISRNPMVRKIQAGRALFQ